MRGVGKIPFQEVIDTRGPERSRMRPLRSERRDFARRHFGLDGTMRTIARFTGLVLAGVTACAPRGATQLVEAARSGPHERYCSSTYDVWDAPQCVGELDSERRHHVGWQTRLVEEGGRIVRMDIVNGRGRFWADSPTVASTRFVYDGSESSSKSGSTAMASSANAG